MRYWVYLNDKVEGPFEEEKLVTLQGFTPDTLICAEDAANSDNQEWVKASSIFEFDQVPVTQPAAQAAPATAQNMPAQTSNSANNDLTALLLGKIEALTAQISNMQTKLDDMETKLQDAVSNAQPVEAPAYTAPQEAVANTITLTQHDVMPEANEEATITNTDSLVSKAEDMVAAETTTQEQKIDMLDPIDLGTPNETALGSNNGGEDLVLSSAMDSLYNAQLVEEAKDEKEITFQDLLTPAQAEELASQADALKQETSKLDEVLKAAEDAPAPTPVADEAAKEAFLSELTGSAEPKEDVLDQVIKEKQEEQKANTLKLAEGADAMAAQDENKEDKKEETAQSLDFNEADAPALSIAPDAKQPEVMEEVLPASEMPADQPAQEAKPVARPAQAATDMPSLDDMGTKEPQTEEEDKKEATMQELVPGAKTEKPEGVLITEADLKDAFTERDNQADQTVEQLFGIDNQAQQPVQAEKQEEPQEIPSLDAIGQQTAEQPLPVANPNDLTEIELKEGSTYLISDFVPPASTNDNSLPKEFTGLQTEQKQNASQEQADAFTEMVSSTQQTEVPVPAAENAPADVTVSQVILENTIKTKRGATLDIKTVPMVPEPAQSERLQIEGLEDDLNIQHDMKSADEKPAGKTKMLVGVLVALVLAALIYAMLAFMNLIPPQFNLLADNKAQQAQQAAHEAQMDEMLYDAPQTVQPGIQQPQQAEEDPMDAALAEVKNYPLVNGFTLQEFIEAKHPAAQSLITWDISTAVDPDNYSVLVKVPPENPQSFKISYRFNYNTVTKALDPTISDAKNLLDSANQGLPSAQ